MKLPQIPETIRRRVREVARERCGYCLSPQRFVMGVLEIEHLVPRAKGGSSEEENLWLFPVAYATATRALKLPQPIQSLATQRSYLTHVTTTGLSIFVGAQMESESKASRLWAEPPPRLSN